MQARQRRTLGAVPDESGVGFSVWAPEKRLLEVVFDDARPPVGMQRSENGRFHVYVEGAAAGDRYRYRIDGENSFPDPASRYQPDGVHGSSEVIDPNSFQWRDSDWSGVRLNELIIYELHIGTFTPEGTFDALRLRLPYLRDLGVTAIELMPVADFPGRWNWGYDHASLFAPSRAYGHPDELRHLVDEAHQLGMAVLLDVIFNHFGPDGAYAPAFAPFFTDNHHTPWGPAINLDDEHSAGVRAFFIENALHWLEEYHFDGLRLDATQELIDGGDTHFLAELAGTVKAIPTGPERMLIAEDSRNLNTILRARDVGGFGLDGVWVDDFHHLIRNRAAGDHEGYYASFVASTTEQIARAINRGWFFEGQRTALGLSRGTDASGLRPEQFVYYIQNHDQIGNRAQGNRLTDHISLPLYRSLSALLLFVPQTPLLFMGQEWAASTPFLFFSDHHEELGRAVTAGRRKEFEAFEAFKGDVPDPQEADTFRRSKLMWDERERWPHVGVARVYGDLLSLRNTIRGAAIAAARSESILEVQRGNLTFLVAFDANAETDIPGEADIVWHSERDAYAYDAAPPVFEVGRIRFLRPSAIIFRA